MHDAPFPEDGLLEEGRRRGRPGRGDGIGLGALRLRLRAEARDRWRSWTALALVAGLVWGGAIAALSGARRTETAYLRFLEDTRRFDVLVTNGSTPETINRQFDFDQVARLPEVAEAAPVSYYFPSGETPSGRRLATTDITPFVGTDGRFGTELNRAHVLKGRLPQGEEELAVTFLAAERFDIDVGDTMPLGLSGPRALAGAGIEMPPARPFRVVGVVAMQGGFPPLSPSGSVPPLILLSPAFARSHPDAAEVLAVRLQGGRSDVAAFTGELERLARGTQVVTLVEREQTSAVQRGLDVQATVLRLLAAGLAAVALLLSGQSLSRQSLLGSADDGVLRALGLTLGQRCALGLARALLVG
ncbi:MAG: ABC transporter permease, partial [Actinomycetota bacterium]|nr:ABC transporter permease [Actinomycetota bacterium]